MTYELLIKRQAKKMLQKLSRPDKVKITEKIIALGSNPNNPLLDIKPLVNQPFYRLRVGEWRVIYNIDTKIKIISIEKINSRGDIYK